LEAICQTELAIQYSQMADSASVIAVRQSQLAKELADSLVKLNYSKD